MVNVYVPAANPVIKVVVSPPPHTYVKVVDNPEVVAAVVILPSDKPLQEILVTVSLANIVSVGVTVVLVIELQLLASVTVSI